MASEVHRVVLQSRPGVNNVPKEENFAYVKGEPLECKDGEMLVKSLYISVDPYMRNRMNDPTGSSYLSSWPLDEAPTGGGVGIVVESRCDGFSKGDIVKPALLWSWQDYNIFDSNANIQKIEHP